MKSNPPAAIAVILARAGSKGVPGKNSALVAGRPCVCWTIDDARAAACVGRVVLSTDDAALQQLGVALGVDIVARPAPLASDTATIDSAARHALEAIRETHTRAPIVVLYANVPVRPRGLIDRAVTLLVQTGADSAQSYAPVGKHHPWWTARLDDVSGRVAPWEGSVLNHGVFRRQDLPPACIPDGGVIALTADALMLRRPGATPPGPHDFLGVDRRGITTREGEVIDIDAPLDLVVADAVLRGRAAADAPGEYARAGVAT
jgi:N-acylneuraminate cytidylyltransferase